MLTLHNVLYAAAVLLFLLAAFGVQSRANLVAGGLLFLTLSLRW